VIAMMMKVATVYHYQG